MFTVCPKCALTLVVTAADLRIAQGYVRCGRCSSVFNALARLSERQGLEGAEASPGASTTPPAGAAAASGPPPGAPAAVAPSAEAASGDEALEFDAARTDVNSVFVQASPDPEWTAATGSFRALVTASLDTVQAPVPPPAESQVDIEIDAAFLATMLRDEANRPDPKDAPPPGAAAAPRISPQAAQRAQILAAANELTSTPAAAPSPGARTGVPPVQVTRSAVAAAAAANRLRSLTEEEAIEEAEQLALGEEADPAVEQSETAAPPGRLQLLTPYAWPAGVVVAVLLLAAQVLNHYRDQLAASARFNHPLTHLYATLGITLFPHWDLRAYDVRQLGASGDPDGTGLITVRASIKNAAAQPQPLPLLRVTLQDRYGNRIAARDVAPKAYLPSAMPASSFLSVGQRIDAQMGFADPGPNAVGFEIDACLPASGGGITCANDIALR
jgi:predicted Zn finger-like uncharacterized protein